MALSYEAAAARNGELRFYLEPETPINLPAIQTQFGYQYASERPYNNPADPYDGAFGEPRLMASEAEFLAERDRMIQILTRVFGQRWEADILYYPSNRSSAIYHWSSSEGTLHPYTVAAPDKE